jgi:peroxiredoxin
MKFYLFSALLALVIIIDGPCQFVELKGHAPQFTNEYMIIQTIENPITGSAGIIDSLTFNNEGGFSSLIDIQKPRWIFINTGIFRITMYIEPGFGYEINLPPKTKKTEANIRNPFFKPVIAHIQVENEYKLIEPNLKTSYTDINSKIFRFDTLVSSMNNKMMDAFRNNKKLNSDSLIISMESEFKTDTSEYFRKHRKYRYGIIKINSRDVGLQHIYENYLISDSPHTDNPAYMELFEEMYSEFLFYYSRTEEGKSLNKIINHDLNIGALRDTLRNHAAVPDKQLAELIVLNEIYDIYSKNYFYGKALIMLLDSITENPVAEEHVIIAQGIKKRLTRLEIGETPPDFSLLDMKNNPRNLNDFKGKYVYLNFATPDNYSCLKEFPFMNALDKIHSKYLQIVTIMVTDSIHEMQSFMLKNKYNWTALFYGNDDLLLQEYNVKAFPLCFLIDPEGLIVQSPATLPTEGFEQQLFKIMRSRGDL